MYTRYLQPEDEGERKLLAGKTKKCCLLLSREEEWELGLQERSNAGREEGKEKGQREI